MMVQQRIFPLTQPVAGAGSKANNLLSLRKLGARVPVTFCIPWQVHQAFLQHPDKVRSELLDECLHVLDPHQAYAVRSSATAEDTPENSFAGQFKSFLQVKGLPAIMAAVEDVWGSRDAPHVRGYLQDRGIDPGTLQMGVVIQEMVPPVVSGVSFSRNPLTGVRETIVEAVEGPGTALMESGITPMRWVYHHKGFVESATDSPIPTETVTAIVHETRRIAKKTDAHVDMEWVWDGDQVSWVQMRPITTLGKTRFYSNRIAKEMLAGQIKPLIWSVNIPLINGTWIDLLTQVIGPNLLTPHDLAKQFHYRTYFNMGLLGEVFEKIGFNAEALEIMWGVAPRGTEKVSFKPDKKAMRLIPKLMRFLVSAWRIPRHFEHEMDHLEGHFRRIQDLDLSQKTPKELLDLMQALSERVKEAARYNIIVPLSSVVYAYILRTRLQKAGLDPARMDMRPSMQTRRFAPQHRLRALHQCWRSLPEKMQVSVQTGTISDILSDPSLAEFSSGFQHFIWEFGHLSDYGNDFSATPWREEPQRILQMVLDDHEPGAQPVERSLYTDDDLSGLRFAMIRRWYRRARLFAGYRDHVSHVYTLGYGLFRPLYRALGLHLSQKGWMDTPDDIFYLEHDEVVALLDEREPDTSIQETIRFRRHEMATTRDLILPEIIYGDEVPLPLSASTDQLSGIATSPGYAQGPARLVTGLADFNKVAVGDVIVIPHSEVSWTPLFAKAAAVLAESGGILSHSSIIAREYGIPAVVSIIGAMMRLQDNMMVQVDGYTGKVWVLAADDGDEKGDGIHDNGA